MNAWKINENSPRTMNVVSDSKIIVVGAGLSGLAAVHTIIEAGGNVVLVEKSDSLLPPTSNSSQTNAGINGSLSSVQTSQRISDSIDDFIKDTTKNGPKKSELLQVLCSNSGESIDWLVSKFGLSFVLSRSGGHTNARTHKIKDKVTGRETVLAMTRKAMDMAASDPSRLEIVLSATASKLIKNDVNAICGIEYEKEGKVHQVTGPVVLCTGGFGADFNSSTSTISRYRPDLMRLSTSCNLLASTGDGIRLGEHVGAKLVDMMYVQVNPTGLVDPKDPSNRYKAMASEALRGDGGIIIDRFGKRFVNELSKRDFLSSEIVKNPNGPFRILVSSKMYSHLKNHIDEYEAAGLMKEYKDGRYLAEEMGIDPFHLEQTLKAYNAAADQRSIDPFGKAHFRNCPFEMSDCLHAAMIEPVIQYCLGGLMIDTDAHVIGRDGKVISGLFAAGEVTGGIHSTSPLTGNDLLDCIVFGRIAGVTGAKELYGAEFVERNINPELIRKSLIEQVKLRKEKIAANKREIAKIIAETEQAQRSVKQEQIELQKLCEALTKTHGSKLEGLASIEFNPSGTSVDEMLSVESAKAIATELRNMRKRRDEELAQKQAELSEFQRRTEEIETELSQVRKAIKHKTHEKKKIEKDLENIRTGSVVIKEIHQLEELIKEYRERQESAEREKSQVLRVLEQCERESNDQIAELKRRKEETEVMSRLDKVEHKRGLEQISSAVKKMKTKAEFEKHVAEKVHALAANEEFPIFQFPVRAPQVGSSN